MSEIHFRGVVLKVLESGESARTLVVLSKTYGKVVITARGARKANSKFNSATDYFCYCDFFCHVGRGFNSLTQADIIETFYPIRCDLDKLLSASNVLELCERTIMQDMEQDDALLLLLKTLMAMSKTTEHVDTINLIFKIKYLQQAGYTPIGLNLSQQSVETLDYILESEQNIFGIKIADKTARELSSLVEKYIYKYFEIELK